MIRLSAAAAASAVAAAVAAAVSAGAAVAVEENKNEYDYDDPYPAAAVIGSAKHIYPFLRFLVVRSPDGRRRVRLSSAVGIYYVGAPARVHPDSTKKEPPCLTTRKAFLMK